MNLKKYRKLLAIALAAVFIPIQPLGDVHAGNRQASSPTMKTRVWGAASDSSIPAEMGTRKAKAWGAASKIRNGVTIGTPAEKWNADVNNLQYPTTVEDQTDDNCWAYMADAVLEAYLYKRTGYQYNFSEAAMTSQLSNGNTDMQYGFTNLDKGGSFYQALAYWVRGVKYGPAMDGGTPTDLYVTQTVELGSYSDSSKEDYLRDIKNLVGEYGAVGVSVCFGRNDQANTVGGAYYRSGCSADQINHGVTVVGWDDTYEVSKFANEKPSRPGAFLVKNSWGSTSDVHSCQASDGKFTGYYWFSYDNYFNDAFAIKEHTSRSNLYTALYETDYRGFANFMGSETSYSKTFVMNSDTEAITAIGTYVQPGVSYAFAVNGTNVALQEGGQMAQGGWHVFRLQTPVRASAGNMTVQATMTGGAGVPYSAYQNGDTDTSNVCLKVFTSNNLVPTRPTVTAAYDNRTLANNSWVAPKEILFTVGGSSLNGGTSIGYEYQIDNSGTWTKLTGSTFAYAPSAGNATHTVSVRAYNGAYPDYTSEVQDFQVRVDTTKPAIGAVTSKPRTDSAGVEVEVTGITDTDSGVAGYYYSENNVEPTATASWTGLASDHFSFYSTKNTTYYIWVVDHAGNISEGKSLAVDGAPTVTQVTVGHDAQLAYRGSICKFTATVTGKNNPAQTVTWKVAGATDPDTSIAANGELTIGCAEYATSLQVTATSTVDDSKSGSVSVTPISQTGAITSVVVNPQSVVVPRGRSQSFTVRVTGTNSPAQLVNWTLTGNQSGNTSYVAGTLYVASDETSDTLYLTATSKADSRVEASATIRVVDNSSASRIYTVRFYDNGVLQNVQNVQYGKAATAPILYRDGYALTWDKAFNYVTSDLDVHAVWSLVQASGAQYAGNGVYNGNGVNNWTDSADSGNYVGGDGYVDYDSDEVIQVATVNKGIYSVKMDGTAHYKKNSAGGRKRMTVSVPNRITVGNLSYRVTTLDAGCFRNNKKLRNVTLGKNVTKIGASAFYGCSSLKSVKIKSQKVIKIAAGAFEGIAKNAVIHVPRSRLAKYRRLVRSSGNNTARVKAYD